MPNPHTIAQNTTQLLPHLHLQKEMSSLPKSMPQTKPQAIRQVFKVWQPNGAASMKFAITKCLGCDADWTPDDQDQCPQCSEEEITECLCMACNFYHPHDSYPAEKCQMCKKQVCHQCIKMGKVHLVHPCKNTDRRLNTITCSDKIWSNQDCKQAYL